MGKQNEGETRTVLAVSSIPYAEKSRELLSRSGIKAYVVRLPRTKDTGCGYGVHVPVRTAEAERILRSAGIRILQRTDRGNSV